MTESCGPTATTTTTATTGTGPLDVRAVPQSVAERAKAVAAQFESLLLSQMLKEMRSSMFDDGDQPDKASEPLTDTMFSELGLALARAGGLGLADKLSGAIIRQENAASPAEAASVSIPLVADATPPVMFTVDRDLASMIPPGRVSSAYGLRKDPFDGAVKFHNGTDVAMPSGSGVRAAGDGQVSFAGERQGYGLTVEVLHDGGLTTRYAHLSSSAVRPGDQVAGGQVIAGSGSSGRSTGPHLHFEVLDNGHAVDPQGPDAQRLAEPRHQ